MTGNRFNELHRALCGNFDFFTNSQAGWPEVRFDRPEGDWDLIEGGLMTFADPGRDLPPTDELEAFRPAGHCLYRQVLVAARWDHEIITAWTYAGVGLRDRGVSVCLVAQRSQPAADKPRPLRRPQIPYRRYGNPPAPVQTSCICVWCEPQAQQHRRLRST